MNRLEMAKSILEKVPILEKRDVSEWKTAEKLRRQFVADYPLSKIAGLSLNEYVIGRGSESHSFCYRLERELDSLGLIGGTPSWRYGVYYGRTKSNTTVKYRFAKKWGTNINEAFSTIKQSIIDLLKADRKDDMVAIRKNKISSLLKGKLLFIYSPEKFAPIYAKPHLEHFIAHLNIGGTFESEADMQRALMDYRANWPVLMEHHPCLYMHLLYDLFDYPSGKASPKSPSLANIPMLNDAIKGADFIDTMPPPGKNKKVDSTHSSSSDYEKKQKQLKLIGDRGEAIVLEMERRRLTENDRKDLAGKVKHIAAKNDRAGFDILSFDTDGTERPIEVKATHDKTLNRGFYITANELEQASNLKNYHIYFVFSSMSKQPRVLPVKGTELRGKYFDMKAITYHVTMNRYPTDRQGSKEVV